MAEQKAYELLCGITGVSLEKICKETVMKNIGIDSMRIIQLMVKIEEEYGIEFKDEDLNASKIITVNDLFCLINRYLQYNGIH